MKKTILLTLAFFLCSLALSAQEIYSTGQEYPAHQATFNADSTHHIINIFRPNYLITGLPTNQSPDRNSCDVKFQVSIKVDILRNKWGKEFDAFVGYSQISVWDLYAKSSPFYDNTYIPGVYLYMPLRNKKTGLKSDDFLIGFEHRSNGRDDIYSRSVNYGFMTYTHYFRCGLDLQATARMGSSYYGESLGLMMYNYYLGYLDLGIKYTTPKKNWDFALNFSPIWNKSIANITADIGYSPFKQFRDVYLFLQFHYGYDEACRDCRCVVPDALDSDGDLHYNGSAPVKPSQMLRFGIMLHPHTLARSMR